LLLLIKSKIKQKKSQSSFYPGVLSDSNNTTTKENNRSSLNPVSILGFFLMRLIKIGDEAVFKCLNPVSILGFFLILYYNPADGNWDFMSQSSFYPGVLSDTLVVIMLSTRPQRSQSSFYPGVLSDFKVIQIAIVTVAIVSIQFLSWGSF